MAQFTPQDDAGPYGILSEHTVQLTWLNERLWGYRPTHVHLLIKNH